MLWQIEGVAPCLGSAIVHFALPLNAPKGPQMALCASNQIFLENSVELGHSPPVGVTFWRNTQLWPIVVANPLGKLRRQPAQYRVLSSVLVRDPFALPLLAVMAGIQHFLHSMLACDLSPRARRLQKVYVQALLAIVVRATSHSPPACPGFTPVCLHITDFRYEIKYELVYEYNQCCLNVLLSRHDGG